MAKTPEPLQPHTDADPATLAFEALRRGSRTRPPRGCWARCRAGVNRISRLQRDARTNHGASAATAQGLKSLSGMPALRLSAQDWSQEIAAAAQRARHSEPASVRTGPARV